jgi:hypothetical protein
LVKITSVHGATDGEWNFAIMAVPEVEGGLEKRCLYIRTFEIGHSIASKAIL